MKYHQIMIQIGLMNFKTLIDCLYYNIYINRVLIYALIFLSFYLVYIIYIFFLI
jgi:hypothetical protein